MGTTYTDRKINIWINSKAHHFAIYSPFEGWTESNNAMFVVSKTNVSEYNIQDPEIRHLHQFFIKFFDTSTYTVKNISPDYIWEYRSPLNAYCRLVEDSLKRTTSRQPDMVYTLAAPYSKYGLYIQMHYPCAYIMNFMVPNIKSLITPHLGEMVDYYAGPKPESAVLERYHLTPAMIYCRKQLYKNGLNEINIKYYQLRLALFLVAFPLIIILKKRYNGNLFLFVNTTGIFTILFFLTLLYSSRFMPRYILPILPLLTVTIFISMMTLIKYTPIMKSKKDFQDGERK